MGTHARPRLNMTSDSKHFPPLEKWKAKGFELDVFGRWFGTVGDMALPLCEGRMIGQFDCSQKGWVSGKGRSAVWREIPFDDKTFEPQYLIGVSDLGHLLRPSNSNSCSCVLGPPQTNAR